MKTSKGNKQTDPKQIIFNYITTHIDAVIQNLNTSKIFAGIMIIILNIGSKFVNIKLSKSIEGYLKYTFSKQILVFAIAWMGTRDVYIAIIITILFTIFNEYLFNEESKMCCLTETFTNYHLDKLLTEGMENVSQEDINKANAVLEKAKKQSNTDLSNNSGIQPLSEAKAPPSISNNFIPNEVESTGNVGSHTPSTIGIDTNVNNISTSSNITTVENMTPMFPESSMSFASY